MLFEFSFSSSFYLFIYLTSLKKYLNNFQEQIESEIIQI